MRVAIGTDHAGFESYPPYKPALMQQIRHAGHEVVDCGAPDVRPVDYPDIAADVCRAIQEGRADRGVLMCGTGIGMCMTANRFDGIRAANCVTKDMVLLSRSHNDANVLCLGRRVLTLDQCLEFIEIWLAEPFSGEDRHIRRVAKIQLSPERVD